MELLSRSGRLYSQSQQQYENQCSQDAVEHGRESPQSESPMGGNGVKMGKIATLCAVNLVPLIKIGNERVAAVGGWLSNLPFYPDDNYPSQIFSLGEGHTSEVVTYTTAGEEAQPFVPPNSKVALKVFRSRPSFNKFDAMKYQRQTFDAILREIKIYTHSKLAKHPNLVRLLFLGLQQMSQFPTLALEFSPHGSLDRVIRTSHPRLSVPQMRHVTIDIAIGLHAIHSAGFQHGDLKTDNILLMPHEDTDRYVIAKITDFGGVGQDSDQKHHKPTHVTTLWAAPEVTNDDANINWKKADIYSFGLVVGSLWASRCVDFSNLESSCFLSHAIRRLSEDNSSYHHLKTQNTVSSILSKELDTTELDTIEPSLKKEISEFARPLLQASFEDRPNAEELLNSLKPFSKYTTRKISMEKLGGSRDDVDIKQEKALYETYIKASTSGIMEDIERGANEFRVATSAFNDVQSRNTEFTDMPIQLPEDISNEVFLKTLLKQLQCTIPSIMELVKGEQLTFFNTYKYGGMHATIATAEFLKIRDINSATRRETKNTISLLDIEHAIIDNLRHAALYGHSISLATYMIVGEHKEGEFPARLFLSLLALSQSSWAAQILAARWPSYIKIIRKILRNRHFSIRSTAQEESVYLLDCISGIFRYLTQKGDSQSRLTLDQAFSRGAVAEIRNILVTERRMPEVQKAIPSLLHRLSTLTDDEGVQLVRLAHDIGASLHAVDDINTSFEFEDRHHEGTSFCPVTPLPAAIQRGKIKLAFEILNLHVEFGEGLDFHKAFTYGVIYGHSGICRAMLNLEGEHLALLQSNGNPWNPTSEFFDDTLSIGAGADALYLEVKRERLFFHGENYSKAYQETIDMVLTEFVKYAPLSKLSGNALHLIFQLDNLDALKSYIKAFEKTDNDVISALTVPLDLPEPHHHLKEKTPLLRCIMENSYRCFEYILKKYPESVNMFDLSGACYLPSRGKYIRLLLENGANLVPKEMPEIYKQTYLEGVLLSGDIEAASIIESFCSPGLLQQLLFDPRTKHGSVFLNILAQWTKYRHPKLIHAIEWLLTRKAIQILSPKGLPFWFFVIGEEHRPCGNEQQLLDRKLLNLLLDEPVLYDAANTTLLDTFTIFHFAVLKGHREIVDLLIRKAVKITDVVLKQSEKKRSQDNDLKDRTTALDLSLCLYLCDTTPQAISLGGRTEDLKWLDDLRTISSMLYECGCESNFLDGMPKNEKTRLFSEPNFRTVILKRAYAGNMRVLFDLALELLSVGKKPEAKKSSHKYRDEIANIWKKIEKTWSRQLHINSLESFSSVLPSTDHSNSHRIKQRQNIMRENLRVSADILHHVNAASGQSEHTGGLSSSQDTAKKRLEDDKFHSNSCSRHPAAERNIESFEKSSFDSEQSCGIDCLLQQAESLLKEAIDDYENVMNSKSFQQKFDGDIPFYDMKNGRSDDEEKYELENLLRQAQNLLKATGNQNNEDEMNPILSLDNLDTTMPDANIAGRKDFDEENHILDDLLQQAQNLLGSHQYDVSVMESPPNFDSELPDHKSAKEKEFGYHSFSRQAQYLPNTTVGHDHVSETNNASLSQASNSESREDSRESEESQNEILNLLLRQQKMFDQNHENEYADIFESIENIFSKKFNRKYLGDGFYPGDGCPRLHLCLAKSDNPLEVRALIENGADINLIYNQRSPVSLAVTRGRGKSLEVLLQLGASANSVVDQNTQTTLCHLAARHGYSRVMLVLFRYGGNFNATDIHSRTPVMEAIMAQQWHLVMVFKRLGVNMRLVERLLDWELADLSSFE